jgi:hypothetical protein
MENKLDIKKAREFVKDQWWDLKEFINRKVYKKEEKESELYETRWVWYHAALVIELFIIILLLWYIAAGD